MREVSRKTENLFYQETKMKRYCKHIIIDADFIKQSIYECLSDKWKRKDTAYFLSDFTNLSGKFVHKILANNREFATGLIDTAAEAMALEIKNRTVSFAKINYSYRLDGNSGKVREIGVESIKQQVYDYVAVNALKELFERKIGPYQCASIPGRGQVYGKKAIERWIRKKPGQNRVGAKGDIRQCYPSINREKLKRLLKKQVKNDDLLYLVFVLIDSYKQGLSIGSYLSQWLCNYYLSFAYHYAAEKLFKIRKKKDGTEIRSRLITNVLFYMDDFLITGTRKADVKKAMQMLIKFLENFLDMSVKESWELFQIDWIDKNGKHHGKHIDMMGFKIYRDHTEIRRNIFLRARRAFCKANKYIKRKRQMPVELAYKCVAYYGWFKNSDSNYFIKKYGIEQLMKYAKRRVSIESKIYGKATTGTLETVA